MRYVKYNSFVFEGSATEVEEAPVVEKPKVCANIWKWSTLKTIIKVLISHFFEKIQIYFNFNTVLAA